MTPDQHAYCAAVMVAIDRLNAAAPKACKREFATPFIDVAVYQEAGLTPAQAAEVLLGMKRDPVERRRP